MTARRRATVVVVALAAFALPPAAAHAAETFFVRAGGTGDCTTEANACATVEEALVAHRVTPEPGDMIDIGPGVFVGNVAADLPEDDRLLIRGTRHGPRTILRGVGAGAYDFGPAVLLGACGGTQVRLRHVSVDTKGADSDTFAIEAEGGSDLFHVRAANQPGSDAGLVVFVCERGTAIDNSLINTTGSVPCGCGGDAGVVADEGFKMRDSRILRDSVSGPGIVQAPFGPPVVVRRSWIESDPANPDAAILTDGDLTLDSSLITGGEIGVERDNSFGAGGHWQVRNATIDLGTPGVYDPGMPDLLLDATEFDLSINVHVNNSILAEEIQSDDLGDPPGPGSVECANTDVQAVVLDSTFINNCVIGADGNTTTDPALQFVGGAPFDWSLQATAPALEAGTPGAIPTGYSKQDLAGNARLKAATAADCPDPVVDMGAYEFQGPPCA